MFASFCAWQVDPSCLWNPVMINTKVFAKHDIHKSIVVKELIAILFAITSMESVIRSTTQKVCLFTDSLPLSFLHRNKNYGSGFYDAAIYLSSFPNLEIIFMAFSDIFTRQFHEAYMNSDSSLSVDWAQLPLPNSWS